MNKRDPYFDNVKFFLIYLVILGHLPITKSKIDIATLEWIFSFHMPLFVFLSGYFTKINQKYWYGIIKLLETFFVFTIIHIFISSYLGKHMDKSIYYIPRWTLWYIFCLICWRIMIFYIPFKIRNNHVLLFSISVVLCLSMGWIPISVQFSFQRFFSFFPFFVLGFIAKNIDFRPKGVLIKIIAAMVMIIVWCVLFFIPKFHISLLFLNHNYYQGNFSPLFYFVFRFFWLLFAGVISYSFLVLVPQKEYKWTHFGSITLFIYLYHSVILLWRFIIIDKYNLPTNLLCRIVYSIIILTTICLVSKLRVFHWLLNPISSMVRKV